MMSKDYKDKINGQSCLTRPYYFPYSSTHELLPLMISLFLLILYCLRFYRESYQCDFFV